MLQEKKKKLEREGQPKLYFVLKIYTFYFQENGKCQGLNTGKFIKKYFKLCITRFTIQQ